VASICVHFILSISVKWRRTSAWGIIIVKIANPHGTKGCAAPRIAVALHL